MYFCDLHPMLFQDHLFRTLAVPRTKKLLMLIPPQDGGSALSLSSLLFCEEFSFPKMIKTDILSVRQSYVLGSFVPPVPDRNCCAEYGVQETERTQTRCVHHQNTSNSRRTLKFCLCPILISKIFVLFSSVEFFQSSFQSWLLKKLPGHQRVVFLE